jgi:hypothetical protein
MIFAGVQRCSKVFFSFQAPIAKGFQSNDYSVASVTF